MKIVLRPRAQVEQAWREWEEEARSRLDAARPSVVMADESAALLDRRELVFRGCAYIVPPTPYPLAARLLKVQDDMRLLAERKDARPEEVIEAFARAIELMRAGLYPKNPIRRLLWRLTPNPFRRATPREVGELQGFFCAFLVLDGVAPSAQDANRAGTSAPRSPASSRRSRPGLAATATRSPGATS